MSVAADQSARVLPHSLESESGLLSVLMQWPETLADIEEVQPDDFYNPGNLALFEAMTELVDSGEKWDVVRLHGHLADKGVLEQVGGPSRLAELHAYVPTAAQLGFYAKHIRRKRMLRDIIRVGHNLVALAQNDDGREIEDLMQEAQHLLFSATEDQRRGLVPITDSLAEALDSIEAAYKSRGRITRGLTTGFTDLDRTLMGVKNQQLVIVAARPSKGKSAFLLNLAEHFAVNAGAPVALFSLEMSSTELSERLLLSRSRVNLYRLKDGFLAADSLPKIAAEADTLARAPLYLDDTPALSIYALRSRARRAKLKHKIGAVVVDYLQLVTSTSRAAQSSRQQEVSEVSKGLKHLAKELDVPVIAAAQLNREADSRRGPPKLSDLRESGAIEQDADIVALLHRADPDKDDDDADREAELIVAKHRNGPVGRIPLVFLKEYARFEAADTERPLFSNNPTKQQHP